MKPNDTPVQYFYKNKNLDTIKSGNLYRKSLRVLDQPLAEQELNTPGSTIFLATDANKSNLRAHGLNEQESYNYSAYGYATNLPSNGTDTGFNGEHIDKTVQGYLLGLGYRAYNSQLMRFHSPDNMSPFGNGGLNAYAYCSDDPINFNDPSGHMALHNVLKPTRTASYYQAKIDKLISTGGQKLTQRNKLADRFNAASPAEKKQNRLYEISGKRSQQNRLSYITDRVKALDKEIDSIKNRIEKNQIKLDTLNSQTSGSATSASNTSPPNRASIVSNYDPSAPRASIISNYDPSAPRRSIISQRSDLPDENLEVRQSL
jgi:RHS repeat-associated protein